MEPEEFDKFAYEYHDTHKKNIALSGESPEYFHRYKILELSKIIKKKGCSSKSILDFGSGIGNSIPYIKEFFPDSELICADVSSKSLALAKSRYSDDAKMLLIENNHIELPPSYCDVIFTACVFHHIAESQHIYWLQQLKRVIKPGGVCVLFEHNPLNPLTVHAVNTCPFDVNAKLQRAPIMQKRFVEAGWHRPQIRYHVFFPGFLSFARKYERFLNGVPVGAQYSLTVTA